jgi:[acyl-carrier-protein] S-malonyltransferase
MGVIFLFPGQNSRYPGMLDRLLAADPENGAIVGHASQILGRDLRAHFHEKNAGQFASSRNVQIGVFLANHLYAESLKRRGVRADYSLGLSLGEYNHLVDIGALDFADALRLLEQRGAAYDSGPSGIMVAVFPVRPEEALEAVRRAGGGRASVGMFNTPRQCVLSGENEPVETAAAWLEEELGVQAILIEPRLPMHSTLFREVGERFRPALEYVEWHTPVKPYFANVLGCALHTASAALMVDLLSRHPWNPVRWRESVDAVAAADEEAVFVETGPRSVLHDMLRRWIDAPRRFTDVDGNLGEWLDRLASELTHGRARTAIAG